MSQNTIAFHNRLPFPVKIYRQRDNRLLNLLQPNQRYVEQTKVGTELSLRIAYGSELEIGHVTTSTAFQTFDITPESLRSVPTQEEGTAHLSEDIELDLYRIEPDGTWTLLSDFTDVNPSPHGGSTIDSVQSGMFFVATVPGDKNSLLFVYLVTDNNGQGNYGYIIGHYYAKGFTSDEGVHTFEDVFVSQSHRILPNGHLQLNEGEVVVYQSPNFNQDAGDNNHFWLFSGSVNDLGHYSAVGGSCIPGPNTIVTIYSDSNMGGASQESDQGISDSSIVSFRTEKAVGSEAVHIGLLNELGQDYDKDGKEITVYRTTLSINNPDVSEVYLEAEAENTGVEIEGKTYTLNPYNAAFPRGLPVPINGLGRVVIRQRPNANSLHIPELFINTNTMGEHERIVLHRDAALHRKIADLKSDFKSSRAQLGLETDTSKLPDSACDAAQKVLQSMAHTAITGYHQDTAVRSTRRYDGTAMADSHWWLDNSGGSATYSRIEPGDYQSHVQQIAQDIEPGNIHDLDSEAIQSSPWDWIEEGWDEVKHIGAEVADEMEKSVTATIIFVKNDVTYMYQFTLKAAAAVAGVMKAVLDAIKLAIDKLIEFIRFLFNLGKIKAVYDALYKAADGFLVSTQTYISNTLPTAKDEISSKLASIRSDVISPLAGQSATLNSSSPPTSPHHNEVQEKLEWIVSLILANPHGFTFSTPGPFEQKVQDEIVNSLESTALSAIDTLKDLAQHPGDIKADATKMLAGLLSGMIDGAINVIDDGIGLVQQEAKQLEQVATSEWQIPVLMPILSFCGLSAPSPLQVVCMTYAVPVGVFCALEDIDVDGLTLGKEEVLQVLAVIADFLNAVTSTVTTLAIGKGSSPKPANAGVFFALCKVIDALAIEAVELEEQQRNWMAASMYGRAVLGLIVALATEKPAVINGVIDILCGAVKLGIGIEKGQLALAEEGLGWALELLGFTKEPPVYGVGCVAEVLVFLDAGLRRL